MPCLFTLDRLGIRFKTPDEKQRESLRNISLQFFSNERIGLLGRNGSGKTCLVRIIGGVDRPTTGSLKVQPAQTRAQLVLQRPEDHFARGTVAEQINSFARKFMPPGEIHTLLLKVGLSVEVSKISPLRLSTGQQRLVAIACALASQAPYILLDEPMAGLDGAGRNLVKQALVRLHQTRQVGWVIVSHHPDDLLGLVERIWLLEEGQLVYDGPFSQLPLDILERNLADDAHSLYYRIRKLEGRGVSISETLYACSEPSDIVSILRTAGVL